MLQLQISCFKSNWLESGKELFAALYCKLDQIFSSVSRGNGCPDLNLPPVARESEISCRKFDQHLTQPVEVWCMM